MLIYCYVIVPYFDMSIKVWLHAKYVFEDYVKNLPDINILKVSKNQISTLFKNQIYSLYNFLNNPWQDTY